MYYIDNKEALPVAHLELWNKGVYKNENEFLIALVVDLQESLKTWREECAIGYTKKSVDKTED